MTVPATGWPAVRSRASADRCDGGLFFGALALLDSGMLLARGVVFVVTGAFVGVWTVRRMNRYWSGADELSPADRVTVVRAARRGYPVGDPGLARGVLDYDTGLRASAEPLYRYGWVWRWFWSSRS